MGACVLLLHELSDGDSHYDWLIDPHDPHDPHDPQEPPRAPGGGRAGQPGGARARESDPGERALIAFRLSVRIDLALPRRFEAQRIADHRRLYLDYEGPVSGGRGSVRRLAAGWMRIEQSSPQSLILAGRLGEATGRLSGAAAGGDRWVFSTDA